MLKNFVKFLLIIQLTIVLGVVWCCMPETKLGQSIEKVAAIPATKTVHVIDADGNIQKNSLLGTVISVKKDNMTVSGTAKTDCLIDIDENVKTVTLENLQQNGHDVSLNFYAASNCKVIFKGSNEVYDIYGDCSLTIEGADGDAELVLTNSVYVMGEELNITAGNITAPHIYSEGAITITGDSRIHLKPMEDQDTEFIYARLEAYDMITIDLTGEGIVEIDGNVEKDLYTTYSAAGFVMGDSTDITLPENGYHGLFDPEYDDEYCIMDENGDDPDEVIIKAVE